MAHGNVRFLHRSVTRGELCRDSDTGVEFGTGGKRVCIAHRPTAGVLGKVRTTARETTEGRDSVMNTYETDSMTLSRPLVLFVSLSGLNTSVRPSSPLGEFPGRAEHKCSAVRASWCVRFSGNASCLGPHPEERPSRKRGRVSKDGRRIPSLRHTLRDGRAVASAPVGPAVLRAC